MDFTFGGGAYAVLADGPNLTRVGEQVRDNFGWNEPDLSLDLFQTPILRGRSEYLRLRSGAEVLGRIRRGDTWQYTARGRAFHSRRVQLVEKPQSLNMAWVLESGRSPMLSFP